MLDRQDIFRSNGFPVEKVLELTKDGSILYVCANLEFDEVRKYDLVNCVNKRLYVHRKHNERIINATINPSNTLLAFTVIKTKEAHMLDRTNEASNISETCTKQPMAKFKMTEWLSNTHQLTSENGRMTLTKSEDRKAASKISILNSSRTVETCISGTFITYLTSLGGDRIERFDDEGKLMKSVHFLDQNNIKDLSSNLTENRLLFLMDRSKIGVYVILSHPSEHNQSVYQLAKRPNSTRFVHKAIWSQYDPETQRIYYIICSNRKWKKENGEISCELFTRLCCEHSITNQLHEQLFIVPIDLGIPKEILTAKTYEYVTWGMCSNVSSKVFNIRILQSEEGKVFLCWQILTNELWKIIKVASLADNVVLDIHEIVAPEGKKLVRASFCMVGSSLILVHLPGSFTTVINTHGINKDNHLILKYSDRELSPLPSNFSPLPRQWNYFFDDGFTSDFLFDHESGHIFQLLVTKNSLAKVFKPNTCPIDEVLFLVQLGCAIWKENQKTFPILEALLMNLDKDKNLAMFGDEIVSNILSYVTAMEVCKQCPTVPLLKVLLPTCIQSKTNMTSYDKSFIEIKRYQISAREEILTELQRRVAIASNDIEDNITQMREALVAGSYPSYSTNAIINGELACLHGPDSGQMNKLDQFSEIFDKIFSKSKDALERKLCLENKRLIVLTYQNMLNHLSKSGIQLHSAMGVAREYIHSQIRMVEHGFVLFQMLTNVRRDFELFSTFTSNEKYLLHLLNQFVSACTLSSFPMPLEASTLRTSLHFKFLISKHGLDRIGECGISDTFTREFVHDINSQFIKITPEFIAKLFLEIQDDSRFYNIKNILNPGTTFQPQPGEAWINCSLLPQLCIQARKDENIKTGFTLYDHYKKISPSKIANETMKETIRKYGFESLKDIVF